MSGIDQAKANRRNGTPRPALGVLEWLRPGEHDRAERLLEDLKALGVRHLRTGFSWADWYTDGGAAWYAWLLPRLARDVDVLPCFTYTPPSLGVVPKTSSPPRNPKDYADFLDVMITRFGDHFEWVELWNEPNNINDWDWRMDPQWAVFSEMIEGAAYWCHRRGKRTVLGGMCPTDRVWLDLLARNGVLEHLDAVGVHGFPGTWEYDWTAWHEPVGVVRGVLDHYDLPCEVWITEGGYSTWRHDEFRQLQEFARFAQAPADRAYWYAAHDLHPDLPHQDGFHQDERHYHFGLKRADGSGKLLFRVWRDRGVEGVRQMARDFAEAPGPTRTPPQGRGRLSGATSGAGGSDGERPVLITGGAGFVGTNLADRLIGDGRRVIIYDSLARPGVEENLRWLRARHGDKVIPRLADVRDPYALREAVREAGQVFHFAAQVAVTTSLRDPAEDFAVNVQGTIHLLEALRALADPPPLLFTSTNKVYGDLPGLALQRTATRYEPADAALRRCGVNENQALSFFSPYGCSKGAADQYVLDYARSYGLPAVVFRMSCIYGPHQFGTEDQGWVAHFLLRALQGEPIGLYGDGLQVRDLLHVDDLVRAMRLAQRHARRLAGQAFNLGGGPERATSLVELIDLIGTLRGGRPDVRFGDWRPGDQRYYVADTTRFQQATGWAPEVDVREGVAALWRWLAAHRASDRAAAPRRPLPADGVS